MGIYRKKEDLSKHLRGAFFVCPCPPLPVYDSLWLAIKQLKNGKAPGQDPDNAHKGRRGSHMQNTNH